MELAAGSLTDVHWEMFDFVESSHPTHNGSCPPCPSQVVNGVFCAMVVGVLCHLDQPVSGSASGGTRYPCPGLRLPAGLSRVLVGEPCYLPRPQAEGAWLQASELLTLAGLS